METEAIKNKQSNFTTRLNDIPTSFKLRVIDTLLARHTQSKLRNKNFSIICNNCIAWGIYHKLGLPFTTPTIGLFFFSEDYIKFLENFDYYIKQPLKFKETSIHPTANELSKIKQYPIGILGYEIEIHFLHYIDEAEAAEKWKKRVERIQTNNLFFIYSDAEEDFKEEFLLRYLKLPFENKIFFSSKPRNKDGTIVFVQDYWNKNHVGDSTRNRKYEKYIDVIKWLNKEKDFLKNR